MTVETGWERSRRVHFDEIVETYDKARWDYPSELYEDIFKYCGAGKKALEIGAGTGRATIPFLNADYDITAVELAKNMVEFLTVKFSDRKNFNVLNAAFEDVVLDENVGYDLIYAASAFHWVDAEIGCPKVFRLLKPGGAFVLFRNNAQPSDGEPLYEAIRAVYEKYYNSYYTNSKRPVRQSHDDFWKLSGLHKSFSFDGMEQYGFQDITMKLYDVVYTYTADEYISLMSTYSDNRALPKENRMKLYKGVHEAITQHGGILKLDCIFQLYMGRKP
ncbi:MAG: class I SAM-dependent methyltransferase [Defluviitaleaceae bacterium]|nr:class I SAM-dependent methyltransferase [Defluviitaleaceae bacterium]